MLGTKLTAVPCTCLCVLNEYLQATFACRSSVYNRVSVLHLHRELKYTAYMPNAAQNFSIYSHTFIARHNLNLLTGCLKSLIHEQIGTDDW